MMLANLLHYCLRLDQLHVQARQGGRPRSLFDTRELPIDTIGSD